MPNPINQPPADAGLRVQTGFQAWIAEPARARSPEVDYGCWWWLRRPTEYPHWRVSFIVDTGEVYAVAMAGQRPDQFIVLGHIIGGRPAMETAMHGWADGETLRGLPDLAGRFE